MAKKFENIENIKKLITEGAVTELAKSVIAAEKQLNDIMKKLNDLEKVKAEQKQRLKEQQLEEQRLAAQKVAMDEAARISLEKADKTAESEKDKVKVAEQVQQVKNNDEAENTAVKVDTSKAAQSKQSEVKNTENRAADVKRIDNKHADKPADAKKAETRYNDTKRTDNKFTEQRVNSGAGNTNKTAKTFDRANDKFFKPRTDVSKNYHDGQRVNGENRTFINKDTRPQKPVFKNNGGNSTYANNNGNATRPAKTSGGRFNVAAAVVPITPINNKAKNFATDKKKGFDKTYVEKEKHTVSKRALQKQQGITVEDFDENKSGYRKLRVKKDKKQANTQLIKIEKAVVTSDDIPIKILSEKLGISAVEITKKLFKDGIMKTVNENLDYDTAALLAAELGIELEYKPEKTAEEVLIEKQADTVEEIESLVSRAPVVTVMGHVDHGKTSLLDYIRKSNCAAGEAGGITQHIGAYTVTVNGKGITFIDTPGHEAFTAMRARGAQVTDIVILVVAADDGIKPQTIEAINHAKAAGVQIIVAANKIDKTAGSIEKVKQDLVNNGLVPEEWGGDTVVCPISCKTGQGIDNLLENLLLIAEMKELLANPAREARGVVIEARLDKGKGPVATVLIQNGTLHTGDNIITGTVTGRVRAMLDDMGKTVKEAGPSMAVNVLGLEEVPNSGDSIFAVSQDLIKEVIEERKRKASDAMIKSASKVSLEEMFGMIAEGNLKTLNLIVKGDVQGSVEAVKQSVVKLSNSEVQVKVIHSGAGAITESDVMLADSSNAIILGFNVRPDAKAKTLAERSKVDIRSYRIIYDLLDDMEAALKGMLAPKYREVYLGKCEVRQTFKITGVGNIAGCYVLDGKIIRGGKLRIYRENVLVVEGNVQQLKRFKDDVKEVSFGFECGCAIEGFNDIKVGDIIECYMIEEIKAV